MEETPEMPQSGAEDKGRDLRWSPDQGGADAPPLCSDQILENVLENVLCFLPSRRDLSAASLVCKSWYRIDALTRREIFIGNCYATSPSRVIDRFRGVRSLVLKGKPRFSDFHLVPSEWGARFSPWVAAMSPVYPWLEQIYLKRMTVTDEDIFVLVCSFPYFRKLTLVCCDGFSTAGLAMIAENCSHLQSLDLIENDVEDIEEEALDWVSYFPPGNTCLESLVFDCVGCAVSFESLAALVARSPFLRRLRVNEFVSVGELCQLMARAPQITDLGTGSISSPEEQGGFEAALESSFRSSKSLSCLSGLRGFAPEYLHTIYPVCTQLTSLNVSYAQITPEQLKPVITCCHNLETFWVLDTVHDEGLQMVAAACKKLKELRVFPRDPSEYAESSVSDVGLAAISEGCRELQSILYFCQSMTNAAVVTMSNNCQDLVVFRLCIMGRHRSDHLTGEPMDEGFGAIVRNCKKLTRLAVSGLLTDLVFSYIGKYGKLVRTLSVAFAGNSDLSLSYLLQGCPKLQKLEIRDCPFGDAGLLSGIHHYYNMRFLWMSACNISVSGCKQVARELPRMVVEVFKDTPKGDEDDNVGTLYMYRSLVGPRNDAPTFVNIL